ncbi:MAG: PAS domain S-box protein, partial [bacterium]
MVEKKRVKESLSTAGKDGGFLIRADDFHLVFETIPEGVVVIEARGRIVYANRAAEKILGIKKKGASGKTYDDPQWKITDYDGAPLPKTKLPFYLVVKTKKPVRGVRHAIETEKGKRIFLTVNASPMFDRNGKIRAVAASVSDVTESIKNERKLKESEEKYRKLMQNANDAIFAADAETGKIIDVNKKAVELSGRSRKELIGMNRSKLHPSGCAGKYRKMFDFHAKADRSSVQNLILEKKNGERVSVDISATHMDLKGRRVVLGIFRDVSERKMFEEKLIKERNTAREYLHIAGTIIIALDEKGGIRLINRKGCELLGCSEDSAVGKNWFENYIPAHDRLKVKSMYRKTMRGAAGMPEYFENDIISGDKVIRRVAWHNRVIRDKKGKICGAISSGEDITEKKKAQEEIKSSREWFATTLSSIGDGVITANAKGRIQFMNPVACRLTGWKEKDAKGRELKEVFEIVNEVSGKKVKNPAAEVLKKGTIQGLANHTVLINKKGKKIPIEDSAAPIKGSGGKMTGAVLIFHDVTQRRSAERAIKRSEENYRRLFSGISDAVYVYRATTENVGKFIAVNDAACGMTGYTKKELENMSIKDLDEILDYKEAEKAERIMKKGKSFIHESAHKRKDGSKVPVEINSRYLDIEGKRAVLSIVRDISERARIRSREEEINRYNFMRARLWEAAGKAGAGEKELAEYFMKVLGGNLNASNVVYFRLSGGKNHAEAEWRSGEKKRSFMKVKMSGEARRAMEKKQYIYESDKKQNKIPPALKRFFESLEKIKNRPCRMLLTPVFTGREIHGAVVCFCGEDFAGGDDSESGKTAVKEAAAIFGNILEKKRTEQILRESEEKFRSISEQSILGVLILQDGIIRYINKGMSEIIEKNPRDVAGKHIAVLKKTVHPESRRAFKRMFEKDSTGAV